jgi:hypothetical protein
MGPIASIARMTRNASRCARGGALATPGEEPVDLAGFHLEAIFTRLQ